MRIPLMLLTLTLLAGCNCGGSTCTPIGGGDAGAELRTQGEPCTDGHACAPGLACRVTSLGNSFQQEECVAPCADAGTCPSGTACYQGSCFTSCTLDTDCPGRFVATCRAIDAGVAQGLCTSVSCNTRSSFCPGGATCIAAPYCCPQGAPCAAPPDGMCLR